MKKPNRRSKQTNVVYSSPSQSPSAVGDKVHELELENKTLKREIEEMGNKLANFSSTPDASVQKLNEVHLQKVTALEKQEPKSDEAAQDIQDEIKRLRAQKVQLQCKLKLESVQFRLCRSSMQKEILQLKKENRRIEYEMHLLLAINQRQKLVLQRKTKEAFMAMKRLKELLEFRKDLKCRAAGARAGNHSQHQSIEHELDVTVQIQEVCSQYEQEMEEMAAVIEKLKLEAETLKDENSRCLLEDNEVDLRVNDSELRDLKEEVARLSGLLSQMATPNAGVNHQKSQVHHVQSSASTGSSIDILDMAASQLESSEGVIAAKPVSGVCCSCSKKSLCKTSKCGCRAAGGSCGTSCGCEASKCSNRGTGINEIEKHSVLASQDAMLFQNTLIEKPPEMKKNCGPRKQALKEIGNTLMKPISRKPGQRKKGQKPVTENDSADMPCSPSENTESPRKAGKIAV
ncbi:hypothetical protein Pint_08482 [Pistacia integerrima]|uniref:Uncharacterized protein n=1 Tax=Pistacia integerrima TaxID=434235 RepID=A0ACC0XVT3_9ROSI|nr:hypothetical protein Pint_08482 [Pistacia integerrima]